MVRKTTTDSRLDHQPVVLSNNTAAHFLQAAQPAWMYSNTQAHPLPPRPYTQQNVPQQALPPRPTPWPNKTPAIHATGTVQNADGLPSPAPSHESNRATPESSVAQSGFSMDNMMHNHGPSMSNNRQTANSRPASTVPNGFHPPAAPTLVTAPFQDGTMVQSGAGSLSGLTQSGPTTYNFQAPQAYPPFGQARSSSNAATPVQVEQSSQTLPSPNSVAQYLSTGGYSIQMHAYFNSRTTPAGLDIRLHTLKHYQTIALNSKPVDVFFLLLLQLVCINNTEGVTALPMPWRDINGIQGSLSLISAMIGGSYGFTQDFCQYFAKVPRPIHETSLMDSTVTYLVGRALTDFLRKYHVACKSVLERGFPLLPDEFYYDLHIISPIAQKLFNDHFLVVCFIFNDATAMGAMQNLFQQCSNSFYSQRLHLQQRGLADTIRPLYEQQTRPLCQRSLQMFQAHSAQMSNMSVQHGLGLQGLPPLLPSAQRRQSHPRRPQSNGARTQGPTFLAPSAGTMGNIGFGSSVPSIPMAATTLPITNTVHMIQPMPAPLNMRPPSQPLAPQTRQQGPPVDPAHMNFWNRGDNIITSATSNPVTYAIHQLYLLDKYMKVEDTSSHPGPFFQMVAAPPLPMQVFSTERCSHSFRFQLSQDDIARLPQDYQPTSTQPAQYLVNMDTHMMRFRCLKHEPGDVGVPKHPLDRSTCWPKHMLFTCNGKPLEPRKKQQWHKDLPIDLTPYLQLGENEIKVLINRLKHEAPEQYDVIVERTDMAPAEVITKQIQSRSRPGSEFVRSLFQEASNASDEDDLVVITSTRNVSIIDPIVNGGICKFPVRSANCLHPQAFELESFLQSRLKPAESDVYDLDWSCPICKVYAGPDVLHVEDYLLKVRAVLEKRAEQAGNESMETRTIIISTDGTWIPKVEELDGESGDGGSLKRKREASKPPRMSEVIELD